MFKIQRRSAARLAAAGLATGLLAAGAISGAGAAFADGGATAVLGGLQADKSDGVVIHEGGKDKAVNAGLFTMDVGGGTIQTYCIDIHNPTQKHAKYQEVPWDSSSLHNNPDAGKINWILQHSYPQVADLAALAKASGSGPLTEKTAAAGTQVAIWRFSDKASVDANDPAAEKLAEYLGKTATDTPEPKATLTLDPPAVSGKSGDKLGPVTVHTTSATPVQIQPALDVPAGVKIVNKSGKAVTTASNGDQLFFSIPAGAADGTTSVTATAVTQVPVGRAFTGVDSKSQVQILAGSSATTATATATGTWAKKGPIPAVSATVDCAKNGVDVTASNKGDEAFTFELAGKKFSIEAGKSKTITVPVKEDQKYEITISGPNGFTKTFKGVLDCKTTGTPTPAPSTSTTQPSPASAGSTTGTTGGDLAQTGGSSATPMIAGIAVALVAVGGGAVFFLRRKKSAGTPAGQ
ncbi:LAETG motif-containing sortase-dependent surface protein [Streptomyces fildesensis]|uniref:LAETG motif-containing sortase-dependent surface protein n=1 Tax=Streptomyces fildesensis TaxID=375757 RepID=A0ABW8CD45_9ACTN